MRLRFYLIFYYSSTFYNFLSFSEFIELNFIDRQSFSDRFIKLDTQPGVLLGLYHLPHLRSYITQQLLYDSRVCSVFFWSYTSLYRFLCRPPFPFPTNFSFFRSFSMIFSVCWRYSGYLSFFSFII